MILKSKNPLSKLKRPKKKPGLAPGTLEFTGIRKMERPLVYLVKYDCDTLEQQELREEEPIEVEEGKISWYDIRGLHDVPLIDRIGKEFDIHPLVLEDILNTQQRPKFEEYGNAAFIIITALSLHPDTLALQSEQIAIYVSKNFLLTFQEDPDDTFTGVRERLARAKGRIRSNPSPYLAYALVDNIVDHYFLLLDNFEEQMEQLELEITGNPSNLTKAKIHRLKFQMLTFRRVVMPLREAINRFSRSESHLLDGNTGLYLRDLYDHAIRIGDMIETQRDMLNGLQDLYLSELSLRMNKVIQFLTIITTIFVPLTFLAGVYGMNFDYMPELHWKYGYFILIGAMVLITVASILFFKRRKWL